MRTCLRECAVQGPSLRKGRGVSLGMLPLEATLGTATQEVTGLLTRSSYPVGPAVALSPVRYQ
jgi:hypothetical protein